MAICWDSRGPRSGNRKLRGSHPDEDRWPPRRTRCGALRRLASCLARPTAVMPNLICERSRIHAGPPPRTLVRTAEPRQSPAAALRRSPTCVPPRRPCAGPRRQLPAARPGSLTSTVAPASKLSGLIAMMSAAGACSPGFSRSSSAIFRLKPVRPAPTAAANTLRVSAGCPMCRLHS